MIKIKEITDVSRLTDLERIYKCGYAEGDRGLLMSENDQNLGFAVMGLVKTFVEIKGVRINDSLSFPYLDLLTRSLLAVIRDFNPIWVRIKSEDKYYERFGFKKKGEYYEIISTEINLAGSCCDHK